MKELQRFFFRHFKSLILPKIHGFCKINRLLLKFIYTIFIDGKIIGRNKSRG